MEWFEFIIKLVDILVWPTVLTFLVISFKSHLVRLISGRRIDSVQAGPVSVQLSDMLNKLESSEEANMRSQPSTDNVLSDASEPSARDDPRALMYQQYENLHSALEQLRSACGMGQTGSSRQIARWANMNGLLSNWTLKSIEEAVNIRNAVAHDTDGVIDTQMASAYVKTVQPRIAEIQSITGSINYRK